MIVLWVMTVVGLKQQFKVGARLKGCRDTLVMKNSRRVQRWRVSASMLEFIWICLKIGYIPNYSHLIGIMIINHCV